MALFEDIPLPNPYQAPEELDRIQTPPPDLPLWSENVMMWGHDGRSGTAVFTHLGRMATDPAMWEGIVAVLRPGGEVIIDRSIGHSSGLADTGRLAADCLVPNRRWRLRFDGAAQRTSEGVLAQGDRFDDDPVRLEFDMFFDAAAPMWSLGNMVEQDWASFHAQQIGHWTGFVRVGGDTVWMDCGGIRDHSVGVRDYEGLLGDFWICCLFPSGRSVMGFKVWSERLAEPMSRGFVATRDSISEVTVVESTPLTGSDGTPRRIAATLRPLDAGEPELKITGDVLNGVTLHLLRPFGIGFGQRADDPDTWIDHHCMVRMELDGETGYGWVERIRLAGVLDGSRPQLVD